jgi:hypothetical protein
LLFALDLLGAGNPCRRNFHQPGLVFLGRSLRQAVTFARVFAKTLGIVLHDTFRIIIVPKHSAINDSSAAWVAYGQAKNCSQGVQPSGIQPG